MSRSPQASGDLSENAPEGSGLKDDLKFENEQGGVIYATEPHAVHEEEVILEYTDEVPQMAEEEEVVMCEDDIEYDEVESTDMASRSLVALSQPNQEKRHGYDGPSDQQSKYQRPNILRRAYPMGSGDYVYDEFGHRQPSQSQEGQIRFPIPSSTKPLLPVAVAGTSGAHESHTGNWRERQLHSLEVYEIYDNLPEGMREKFRRVMEQHGERIVPYGQRRARQQSPASTLNPARPIKKTGERQQYPISKLPIRVPNNMDEEMTVDVQNEDGSIVTMVLKDPNDESFTFPDNAEYIMGDGDNGRVMALVPIEEHRSPIRPPRTTGHEVDMPHLDIVPAQVLERENVDVENYAHIEEDEVDNRELDDPSPSGAAFDEIEDDSYYESNASNRRYMGENNRHVILPEMRQDYFGTNDLRGYQASRYNERLPEGESRQCQGCHMTLKRSVYYHHSRMIRKYGVCNMFTPKRFPCGIDGCEERLGTVEKLCEHMYQIHQAPTQIKTVTFNNEKEFEVFLRDLEGKGGNFRMSRGNKMIKRGVVQYYRCNRMQSVAKDKTLRMCDELQQGILNRPIKTDDADPFVVGLPRPHLRTEEACTAFFRKAYLQDGRIEVRYCDFHLHDDERLRLPPAIKERIYSLKQKNLPDAVVILILHEERDRFCQPGSSLERRIAALTSKDVAQVVATNGNFRRRRYRDPPIPPNATAPLELNVSEKQAAVLRGELRVHDHLQEDRKPMLMEDVIDLTDLSEMELRILEEYEKNTNVILTQLDQSVRVEIRRKHKRDHIRQKVFALGRFIKTPRFAELSDQALDYADIALDEMLKKLDRKRPKLELNRDGEGNMEEDIIEDGEMPLPHEEPQQHVRARTSARVAAQQEYEEEEYEMADQDVDVEVGDEFDESQVLQQPPHRETRQYRENHSARPIAPPVPVARSESVNNAVEVDSVLPTETPQDINESMESAAPNDDETASPPRRRSRRKMPSLSSAGELVSSQSIDAESGGESHPPCLERESNVDVPAEMPMDASEVPPQPRSNRRGATTGQKVAAEATPPPTEPASAPTASSSRSTPRTYKKQLEAAVTEAKSVGRKRAQPGGASSMEATSSAGTSGRKRRTQDVMLSGDGDDMKVVKEEEATSPVVVTPTVSRTGRVIRPKKYSDYV